MGVGPIEAVPKALRKAGLTLEQMDTIELNEAFASQALAVIRTLGMDPARVNPWGGAMALGPVSYTHLDVYKRQTWESTPFLAQRAGQPGCPAL